VTTIESTPRRFLPHASAGTLIVFAVLLLALGGVVLLGL
jgi:hypothetical protein